MPEPSLREAEILQAREHLARAFARLPEKIKSYEAVAGEARARAAELQELLDRERVISSQRNSLSDSAKEEMRALHARVEEADKSVEEAVERVRLKDETIHELEALLADFRAEAARKDAEITRTIGDATKSKTMTDELLAKLEALEEANRNLQGQCLRYENEISEITAKENSYAKKFSPKDRENFIAAIDGAIAKIDKLASANGR
jgi:chromosome segregation ATPase